jgi:hypothetical protein
MTNTSSFRGIQGIREIKARMTQLVAWYAKHKPEVRELVIERTDYDLIARWPKAANVEGFDVTDNGIFFSGMRLTYTTGQGRYEKRQGPEQALIQ